MNLFVFFYFLYIHKEWRLSSTQFVYLLIMNKINLKKYSFVLRNLFFYFLSLIAFLWMAIQNGYPIVYPDAGAYIASGCMGTVPVDRPIMYGLFVRHISMLYSLWFVAILQGIIAIYLIVLTMKMLQIEIKSYCLFFICLIVSTITTCGYYIGQIMPDIFSAYMWWALGLIILSEKRLNISAIFLYIIVVFSSITHFSNLLGLIIFSVAIFFIFLLKGNKNIAKKLFIIPFFSIITVLTINFALEKKLFLSKSPSVFFTAKLCSTGILKDYLAENCNRNQYRLCSYQEILPNSLEDFMWGDKSIIEKLRTIDNLSYDNESISLEKDFGKLNRDILSDKKYRARFLKIWLNAVYFQSVNYDAGVLPAYLEGSSLFPMITWHYKADVDAYRKSKQSIGTMDFSIINHIQNYSVIISMIYILIFLIIGIKNRLNFSNILLLSIVILFGYIINIFICEFFSTLSSRFSGRMIWLFPLIVIIDIYHKIISLNRKKSN